MRKIFHFVFKSRHSAVTIYTIIVLLLATKKYYQSSQMVNDVFNEQMLHRQQIAARVGASHINDLFQDWGYDSVLFSGGVAQITSSPANIQDKLDDLMNKYSGTAVLGAIVSDSRGIVIANANRQGIVDLGKDVSNRNYFKWAKTALNGDFYLDKPFQSSIGATKGNQIVTIVSPIYSGGKFSGLIALAVDLQNFYSKYFEPLKITEETRVYLVDKDGNLNYSQYPDLNGKNYIDEISKIDFVGKENAILKIKDALSSGTEGKLIINLPDQETNKIETFLISYAPVKIQDNVEFLLAIASPIGQSSAFKWEIYKNQTRVFSMFTLIVIGYALIEVTVVNYISKKSYGKGYQKGRDSV